MVNKYYLVTNYQNPPRPPFIYYICLFLSFLKISSNVKSHQYKDTKENKVEARKKENKRKKFICLQ